MSWSLQEKHSTSLTGANPALTFDNPCTPGSKIIVLIQSEVTSPISCADSSGSTNGAYGSPSGAGGISASFNVTNNSSSAVTVTVTLSGDPSPYTISMQIIELKSTLGTPILDASDAITWQNDSPPNTNRHLTLAASVNGCAAFACAQAYPDTYVANPDSGWTSAVDASGYVHHHDFEYRTDLPSGSNTVWAPQGVDYSATSMAMVAVAYREPSSLTKKWQIAVDSEGVTLDALVFSGTTGAKTLIDQAQGLTVASGVVKFNVTDPGSFSVGDKRFCLLHNWDGDYNTASFTGGGEMAEVIEE